MPPRHLAATFALFLCAAVRTPGPSQAQHDAPNWMETSRSIVTIVRQNFYERSQAETWAAANADYAQKAGTREAFVTQTRQALARLQASHTAYYTPDDVEYYGLCAIFRHALQRKSVELDGIGADFTADGFVRRIFAGGPAEQAGMRRGDRILQADAAPFHPVRSFRGRSGQPVKLAVQRRPQEPHAVITVVPRRIDPKQEWLDAQRNGSRLISVKDRQIGYVPLFSGAGEEHEQALKESLSEKLAAAHSLVLDFRDGWGGCNPTLVNLFNRAVPRLTSVNRDGKELTLDSQWRKPLVLLINGGTRSGKEAVAFALQEHQRATLVGERTAGAVLAGRCFPLPDGSLLYLAVADVRVDGERLEGRGVMPDVEVADALPFAQGTDPQLQKALELAATLE